MSPVPSLSLAAHTHSASLVPNFRRTTSEEHEDVSPLQTSAWPSPTSLGLATCSLALGTRRELLTPKEDFPWGQPEALQEWSPTVPSLGLESGSDRRRAGCVSACVH